MPTRPDNRTLALLLVAFIAVAAGCDPAPSVNSDQSGKRAPRTHLVELAVAVPGRLSYTADRAGSLRALREVRIVNQEEGRLTELRVREGDRVTADQVLVRYDDRILRAQLDKAAATLKQADLEDRRNRQLKDKGFISADALSRATTVLEVARAEERLLRVRLQHMTITAPFDGVISQRRVEPGNVTPRHTHLLTVIDPSQLVTDVDVSELVIPYLHVGDPAEVRIDALGAKLHPGKILRIHPAINPATRAGRVEVALNPVPEGARAGQFCRVQLSTGATQQVVVPLAALQRDVQGEFVYVFQDDGKVHRTGVASGLRLADRVEIRSGLERGAKVVVKGFLGLKPDQRVKPVQRRDAERRVPKTG